MVRILVQSTHMKVSYQDATDEEVASCEAVIASAFRAEDAALKRTWAVKNGKASAVRSFYIQDSPDPREAKNLLPSGFLRWLTAYLSEAGVEHEVVDMRKWPAVDRDFARSLVNGECSWRGADGVDYSPRNYQIKATIKAVKERGGIIQLPTGCLHGDSVVDVVLSDKMYEKLERMGLLEK